MTQKVDINLERLRCNDLEHRYVNEDKADFSVQGVRELANKLDESLSPAVQTVKEGEDRTLEVLRFMRLRAHPDSPFPLTKFIASGLEQLEKSGENVTDRFLRLAHCENEEFAQRLNRGKKEHLFQLKHRDSLYKARIDHADATMSDRYPMAGAHERLKGAMASVGVFLAGKVRGLSMDEITAEPNCPRDDIS